MRRRLFSFACTLALTALAGCRSGPVAAHTTLVGTLAPLRTAFDADSGEVRAIFLASPT